MLLGGIAVSEWAAAVAVTEAAARRVCSARRLTSVTRFKPQCSIQFFRSLLPGPFTRKRVLFLSRLLLDDNGYIVCKTIEQANPNFFGIVIYAVTTISFSFLLILSVNDNSQYWLSIALNPPPRRACS